MTVILSAVQSLGIAIGLMKPAISWSIPACGFVLMTMLTLTTGSAFIMWLGEQITERGVGNGMSLLIFAGIVVGLPRGVADLIDKTKNAAWGAFTSRNGGADRLDGPGGSFHRLRASAASGVFRCNMQSASSDEKLWAVSRRTCRCA